VTGRFGTGASDALESRRVWWLPIAYGLVVAGMCAAILATPEPGIEELRAVIRATAFTSAIAFLPVFAGSPLHRLRPGAVTRWILANRRYLGLSVAASHFWHLIAIVTIVTMSETFRGQIQPLTIAFGGIGFVLLAAMAATSNDGSQRALGRGWSALHTTGLWVLWLDFIFTYMGTAARSPFHAVMTLAFAGAFVLRMLSWSARRAAVSRA
jgi:methionine sulfoxide reductase heme-binding subunit